MWLVILAITIGLVVAVLRLRGTAQPYRQFGLRDLLGFFFLAAIWLSQLSIVPFNTGGIEEIVPWKGGTIAFVWLVLAAFYAWRRLWAVLTLHGCGVLLMLLLTGYWAVTDPYGNHGSGYWRVSMGSFVGSLVSFPFAVLVLFGFLRRKAPGV